MSKNNNKGRKLKKTKLDEIDYFLIAKLLDNPALTSKALSQALEGKLGMEAVHRRRNNNLFQTALQEPAKEARAIILKGKLRAASKMRKHIENTDPKVSIRACENFLKNEIEQPPVININLGDYALAWDRKLEEEENKEEK